MSDGASDCGTDGGHGHGDPTHGGTHDGHYRSNHSPKGQAVVSRGKDSVELHVESHSACDVKYKFLQLAEELELITIDKYRPNLEAEDSTEKEILPDNAPQVKKGYPPKWPSMWYPGASGRTRLWKVYLCLGKRDGWIFKGPLKPNFDVGTYLEVECVTRSYIEAGDCQTDLVVHVQPLHFWSPYGPDWRFDEGSFRRHLEAADRLVQRLLTYLQTERPPRCEAAVVREQKRNPPDRPEPGPVQCPPPPCLPGTSAAQASGQAPVKTAPARMPIPPPIAGTSGADLDNLFRRPGVDPDPDRAQSR